MARTSRTFRLLRDRGIQVNDAPLRRQILPIVRVENGSASGSQHDALASGQIRQHRTLAPAKTGLTLALEDERDIRTRALFDLLIAVMERVAQQTRQLLADRALARAHGTDEKQVLFAEHSELVEPAFRDRCGRRAVIARHRRCRQLARSAGSTRIKCGCNAYGVLIAAPAGRRLIVVRRIQRRLRAGLIDREARTCRIGNLRAGGNCLQRIGSRRQSRSRDGVVAVRGTSAEGGTGGVIERKVLRVAALQDLRTCASSVSSRTASVR